MKHGHDRSESQRAFKDLASLCDGRTQSEVRRIGKGCFAKVRFDSKKHAAGRARALGMGWYKCQFCKGYHLTKQGMPGVKSR